MKILTIVGKVDSRALVYPLIRGISLAGLTGVVADDGSYRRLFSGKGDIGSVNGIDIGVCSHVTSESVHMLDDSGTPYEYLVVVSSDYIPPESDGIIACHGLDRSMMVEPEEEDDDEFIYPIKMPIIEKPEEAEDSKKKKKKSQENSEQDQENTENTEEVESNADRIEREQKESPDAILIPENIPFTEVQIAFAAAPKKGIPGISLRDSLVSYVYKCEEQKRIGLIEDKNYNLLIVKLAANLLGFENKELTTLLTREEGFGDPKLKKPKK
jgi:hypothetical protein